MARIVMKFGGTSLANLERIRHVAKRVQSEVERGNEVAVIVSAMAGVTNQLVDYVNDSANIFDLREYDVVVSSGEQVTAGLLAVVLQDRGVMARSWLGWQLPMRTDDSHGSARILEIEVAEISRRMAEGQVAVVAGFQGVDSQGRITTLGRLRHLGGGLGGGVAGRALRHLYRRRRRLHHRSQNRGQGAQAR